MKKLFLLLTLLVSIKLFSQGNDPLRFTAYKTELKQCVGNKWFKLSEHPYQNIQIVSVDGVITVNSQRPTVVKVYRGTVEDDNNVEAKGFKCKGYSVTEDQEVTVAFHFLSNGVVVFDIVQYEMEYPLLLRYYCK
jgi:hypothetical protein